MPVAVGIPHDMQDAISKFDGEADKIAEPFIDSLTAQDAPSLIYHYTNDLGLRGILENGRLWLSGMFSLNDPSELYHGISHALKILKEKVKKGPREAALFTEILQGVLEKGLEQSAHYFVCSFSSDGDDLGQWRAYADNGRGYALGFDGKALESAFANTNPTPNNSTFPISYKDSVLVGIQQKMIDSMFDLISLPRGMDLNGETIAAYMHQLAVKLLQNAVYASLFFKHEAYENEKEFRFLQVFSHGPSPPNLKQRFRTYELIKYREFDWRAIDAGALKQIIVGPAADRRKGERFAKDCLAAFNPGVVEVTPSGIPYRAV
jgi:Protein of unknown function (DUF2971)